MTATGLASFAAVMSAIAAVASASAALMTVRMQRKRNVSDAFMRISAQFELAAYRIYRVKIYDLDRTAFASWTDDEKDAVNAWCAHLDLVAVLIQAKQLNELSYLRMYGDVTLRTIYQVAPYCNEQVGIRGKQFLLPLRMFTADLIKLWRGQARRGRYPLTIGFPAQPHLRVNPDLFDSDDAVLSFRVDGKLS